MWVTVAPLAGARIETWHSMATAGTYCVAPLAGARIETGMMSDAAHSGQRRSPRGSAN